jgi:hypothetical protein
MEFVEWRRVPRLYREARLEMLRRLADDGRGEIIVEGGSSRALRRMERQVVSVGLRVTRTEKQDDGVHLWVERL